MFIDRKGRRKNAEQKTAYKNYLAQWGKSDRRFRNVHNIFEDWNFKDRRAFRAARKLLAKRLKVAEVAKKLRKN